MKEAQLKDDTLYYILDYQPWKKNGVKNPHVNDDTSKIMDLKNPEAPNYNKSINALVTPLSKCIEKIYKDFTDGQSNIQIAIVPSSQQGKTSEGLSELIELAVQELNLEVDIIINENFLYRFKSVKSAHDGGVRSRDIHMKSIEVKEVPDREQPLILIDDVYTTGCTILACYDLLEEQGVDEIYMLVIGKTV